MTRSARVRELHRERPRSRFLRLSLVLLAALVLWAWLGGELRPGDLFSAQRRGNLQRFLTEEALPWPLRGGGEVGLLEWLAELMRSRGLRAIWATFWISVVAISLAGAVGALAAPLGARTLMSDDPWAAPLATDTARARSPAWRALSGAVRLVLVLMRAVPEYVWAFLLLAILGAGAWPAVLALAVHNAGILGRLGADTIENLERAPLGALRGGGATRAQLVLAGVFPLTLPRYLLYFFYRFETCVREATVLGMLGVVSLGYYIQDARARMRYDELLVFVALGALLVIAADLLSFVTRRWVRAAR